MFRDTETMVTQQTVVIREPGSLFAALAAVFVGLICLAVGVTAENQPGGYIFAALLVGWAAVLVWRFMVARLVLDSTGMAVPTWRPPRWRRHMDLAEVDGFEVGSERGGTLLVVLTDGTRLRTTITRTLGGDLIGSGRADHLAAELSRALSELKPTEDASPLG